MDIKLKRFEVSNGIRILVFALCVVFFISSLAGIGLVFVGASHLNSQADANDLVFTDNYKDSELFQREFDSKLSSILFLLGDYKSEEFIRNGGTISQERLDGAIESLFYEKMNSSSNYNKYGEDWNIPSVREAFINDHAVEITKIKEAMIMDDLRNYESVIKELSGEGGFTYFASDGTNVLTNLRDIGDGKYVKPENFTGQPAYLIYQDDKLIKEPSATDNNNRIPEFDKYLEDRLDDQYNPNLKVYFAFDKMYMTDMENSFAEAKSEFLKWLPLTVISGILALAALIFLLAVTGKKDEDGNWFVYKTDRIFTELQLGIISVCFFGGGFIFTRYMYEALDMSYTGGGLYGYNGSYLVAIGLAVIIGIVSAIIGLMFILSCVRNLKAGRFVKNSLLCIIIMAVVNGIRSIYNGGSVMRKVVLITLAICLLSATVALAPVIVVIVLILAPKWVRKYDEIKKGVDEVKNGNLSYKIPLNGEGELDQLAKGINEISEASNIAIQNELKNQRLKTDLISNVSHDLKTPLTSIITYVDLLKREGLDSPEAPKYLEVLDQKSQRLKKLTEDLFDAAKASSGAIPVNFEKVDLLSLINQGLGEMADRIEASGLVFSVKANKDKYCVNADGQLLWRVVENLLNNVLKYAQDGSRVYIDLKEQGGNGEKAPMVIMEMKNISKVPLNIDAEELMERFRRGDESRSTEGSGLGLAIAKDLIKLQRGWFEVKIDGDLFKAVIILESCPE